MRARARVVRPGECVYNLGGWAIDQFADDKKPFTREELDQIAPNNPVLLQASYYETYLNSRGLHALGIDEKTPAETWVVRDRTGKPTGRIKEEGIRGLAGRIPAPPQNQIETSTLAMIKDLNQMGLTTFGSAGCEPELLEMYTSKFRFLVFFGNPLGARTVQDAADSYRSDGSRPSCGAPVPDDPMNSFRLSGKVRSRPLALGPPALA